MIDALWHRVYAIEHQSPKCAIEYAWHARAQIHMGPMLKEFSTRPSEALNIAAEALNIAAIITSAQKDKILIARSAVQAWWTVRAHTILADLQAYRALFWVCSTSATQRS